jgi:hypothetical protein
MEESMENVRPEDAITRLMDGLRDPASIKAEAPFSLHVIAPADSKDRPVVVDLGFGVAAGWIALHIGEGLLQRLGGYIFDAIFPYFKEDDQRELIQKLTDKFREVWNEELVREAGVSLKSLENKMLDYTSQQGFQTDRLTDSTSHAQDLVSQLEDLKLPAFQAFWIGAGLQLAVIQARFWNPNLRDEGEKTIALRHIREGVDYINQTNTQLTIWLSNRFGGIAQDLSSGSFDSWWGYFLDGVFYTGYPTYESAMAASDQRYEEELNSLQTEITNPALMVAASWERLARQVPAWDELLNIPVGSDPRI